jgi:hypothetical protein
VPKHFRSAGGRRSLRLTQPKILSVTKTKQYGALIVRSVRSNKRHPRRIAPVVTRACPDSSLRLLLRYKGLTRVA